MPESRVKRRLAAMLAADMVGYSRLMQADESSTIARQKSLYCDIMKPVLADHGGRVVKLMGDGMLVEFASIVDAVECAAKLQDAVADHEANLPLDDRITYRIGINLGDIVIDGDDILGDGVNIASRLEALAEPGGICISAKVFDEVRNKVALAFADLGEHMVKNITNPVRAFGVTSQRSAPEKQRAVSFNDKPAVAVLPFDNLSGEPEQDYFSDGLSEDIITLLSAWRSFPVIARNSSFVFKGMNCDIREIGKELSARYVIEGSVRKSGNRVRVTAQLINAATGHHLWAEKFDGSLDDIFEIQDEITTRIVSSVEPHMETAERNRAAAERASNMNAWDYYLRGRELLHRLTPKANAKARTMFEKAIALDPHYADAYAGLSWTYQREILLGVAENRTQAERKGLENAQKSVQLDNGSSIAHLALGGAYIWCNQHALSIAETRNAAELNPSNIHARLALGNRLDIVGNSGEGIPLLEKSLELHPRDPHSHVYFAQLARAYINARDYEKALQCLHESIRRNAVYPHTYHILAICLGHLGRVGEARDAARKCDELHPGFMKKRANWNIYVDPAANRHLTDGLRKAGLA